MQSRTCFFTTSELLCTPPFFRLMLVKKVDRLYIFGHPLVASREVGLILCSSSPRLLSGSCLRRMGDFDTINYVSVHGTRHTDTEVQWQQLGARSVFEAYARTFDVSVPFAEARMQEHAVALGDAVDEDFLPRVAAGWPLPANR